MLNGSDELINDVLVDSELAKLIVPNKFKHTSKQGRVRRQQLLIGAKRLIEQRDIQDISLADICKEANIPRASAYHFFPNVNSIFLAIRFINFIEVYKAIEPLTAANFKSWKGYISQLLEISVRTFNNDSTKNKLMYGRNTPDFENESNKRQVDKKMVNLIRDRLSECYDLSKFTNLDCQLMIVYNISHSIFAMSFRQNEYITNDLMNEAIIASIAYLSYYLPAELPTV